MTRIDAGRVGRILIRANNWIGDVVMISPAVRAIREHFSGARVAILARSWVLEALRSNPYFDDLIEYDRDGIHAGAIGRLRLVRDLRRRRFDLAVLFQKAFEAAALAVLAGARMRVGYATDLRRPLLTHPLPLPDPNAHHVEGFLGIARALGCAIPDPHPFFHLDAEDREHARALIRAAGTPEDALLIALHPGASKPQRAWHAGRFALLGRRLAERLGARIVLLGGPGDGPDLARVAAGMPAGALCRLPGVPSLRDMGGVLERCRLFVGNDSGPMHVAAAVGVPTVGIFGPGSPRRTAPLSRTGEVVAVGRDYPCSPCRQNFFRECSPSPAGKPFCLEEIGVDEVEAAALSLWRGPHGGRRAAPPRPDRSDETAQT
jgi:heptosyltransferase-2